MSTQPIALKPDIQRLVDEKYEVSIYRDHLVVDAVPYVNSKRQVAYGTIVCPYSDVGKPDHTVYFKGETPCYSDGRSLAPQLINNSTPKVLFDDYQVQHYFSNKPSNDPSFPADYYAKIKHYVDILGAQARMIDPDADARTGRTVATKSEDSPFRYGDSASARAGIVAVSQKLWLKRVSIVGLGGTGGYILDQVAKTPVKEIHLFDGDTYKRHNAFRSPGAASIDQLSLEPKKVDYFHGMFDAIHNGLVPHPYYIDESNLNELDGSDFVFVAVDDGPSRGLICNYLKAAGIPFIDVGMGLSKAEDSMSIQGSLRVTLCTSGKHDHMEACLPVHEDKNGEALYASNIQVADMNALNAMIAVFRWKQHFGFYVDGEQAHEFGFCIAFQSLTREHKGTN